MGTKLYEYQYQQYGPRLVYYYHPLHTNHLELVAPNSATALCAYSVLTSDRSRARSNLLNFQAFHSHSRSITSF